MFPADSVNIHMVSSVEIPQVFQCQTTKSFLPFKENTVFQGTETLGNMPLKLRIVAATQMQRTERLGTKLKSKQNKKTKYMFMYLLNLVTLMKNCSNSTTYTDFPE